ncbi:MAG: NAD(P)-dependent oxidoreductase [Chloroflexi bacterium]|nr:NAD(P)-dependent oxidoreductase [Chloroflexota bacterium]
MSENGKILVTGGAGSVGRRLVEKLLEGGYAVRVFDLPLMDFSGLEGRDGVEVVKGDITNTHAVTDAIEGASAVAHLAAILPPNSERSRERTFGVNVGGTEKIIEAMKTAAPDAVLVFTSSISTYGDTSAEPPPVRVSHRQSAIDIYADSKIVGERLVSESPMKWVALRIAGIAVPAFLAPPDVWPFTPDQRVEMVHRDDVVDALYASVTTQQAAGKVFNIAGGPTWQLRGRDYVNDFYGFMGAPVEDAVYRDKPGWVDWYDTQESQRILRYQNRTYQHYADEMRGIVEAMMAE